LALLAATTLLTGCTMLSPAPPVGLSVTNIRPRQSTLLETSIELTLRLTNEGMQPLALAGSMHKLYVNDSYVGRSVSSESVTVPSLGTSTPTVTLYLENLTLIRKAAEFSQAPGRLTYRLESRLRPVADSPYGEIKTTARGELDLAVLGIVPPDR
jgi:LEA14-like dessication related protein